MSCSKHNRSFVEGKKMQKYRLLKTCGQCQKKNNQSFFGRQELQVWVLLPVAQPCPSLKADLQFRWAWVRTSNEAADSRWATLAGTVGDNMWQNVVVRFPNLVNRGGAGAPYSWAMQGAKSFIWYARMPDDGMWLKLGGHVVYGSLTSPSKLQTWPSQIQSKIHHWLPPLLQPWKA